MSLRLAILALALPVLAMGSGCGRNIGDACNTNVDCSLSGTRFCDAAPPGGYCTVEGCDTGTCPKESVCIRFYSPHLNQSCTYDPCNSVGSCAPDQRCVCDQTNSSDHASMACSDTGEGGIACDANADGSANAHCAPENSERRWCMLKCSSNHDCRNHYECRSTGTLGAEPVPSLQKPYGEAAKFCVSDGQ